MVTSCSAVDVIITICIVDIIIIDKQTIHDIYI